jgi:hypothetical protein
MITLKEIIALNQLLLTGELAVLSLRSTVRSKSVMAIFQQLTCLRNNAGLKPENRALVLARDRQTR